MSYYVRRTRRIDGKIGWTGPIRSARQADKESVAWRNADWTAVVEPSTSEVRKEVRDWERSKRVGA